MPYINKGFILTVEENNTFAYFSFSDTQATLQQLFNL